MIQRHENNNNLPGTNLRITKCITELTQKKKKLELSSLTADSWWMTRALSQSLWVDP